jgi:hypothetical protein
MNIVCIGSTSAGESGLIGTNSICAYQKPEEQFLSNLDSAL